MEEQHQSTSLNVLNRSGATANRVACLLQKAVGEGTSSGRGTWHSGFLFVPGFFGASPPDSKSLVEPRRYL